MRALIKRFIPRFVLRAYHYGLAVLAYSWYHTPSRHLVVIGVTGTSGKSTVAFIIARILAAAGFRVGVASTLLFKIDTKEWLNDKKMTMLGRFALQRLISKMVKANCQYAIIETTSEGIAQFRHLGINYDTVIFTNLYPEHIESHGSFENYKKEKLKLFTKFSSNSHKVIAGKVIPKRIIANLDNEYASEFLQPAADEKIGFTITNHSTDAGRVIRAEHLVVTGQGSEFQIGGTPFRTSLLGDHNVSNATAAIAVAISEGISPVAVARSLEKINGVPGRIEFINEGQPFKVIVDYAFEPKAVGKLYDVVAQIRKRKIIHVLGSTGGGRDQSRRLVLGQLAGKNSAMVIVTNEDPYDEDPQAIIDAVAAGAEGVGKKLDVDLFKIIDRREAIHYALQRAGKNDVVLITGKGCEQAIVVKNNRKIPWDDRTVVREELVKIFSKSK